MYIEEMKYIESGNQKNTGHVTNIENLYYLLYEQENTFNFFLSKLSLFLH